MPRLTRREFLKLSAMSALIASGLAISIDYLVKLFPSNVATQETLHQARYYEILAGNTVKCQLCSRNCNIVEGGRGFCRSRENRDGKFYSLVYGNPVSIHIDPIEKLPMKHVFPGTDSLCVGTASCNFNCLYCINWHIAIQAPEDVEAVPKSPQEIVQMAVDHEVPMICFTYNEPTIAYEYMYDVFKLAKEKGLRTAFHTNGFMKPEPARALLHYVDAVVVDLKAFTPELYSELTAGELPPVLDFLELVKKEDVWLEIVNLVVPGYNDAFQDIENMCAWVKDSLGSDVPIHFSRFFPTFRLEKLSPTPIGTLEKAHEIAQRVGLNYVYIDNVPGHQYSNTYCHQCGEKIIERKEYLIVKTNIKEKRCWFCGENIPGIWEA